MKLLSLLILIPCLAGCQTAVSASEEGLAFPHAEGFGKYATGGRGGKVFIVTNLNDDGTGSLREAIKKKGARIIAFAVSGTIALKSDLVINNGDITIAGQSAPGDGICLKNYQVRISANNVVIRYLRFRMGDEARVQGDSFGGMRTRNIIIDHCSISWATDECASFYYNENFTMQWCIISESLNASVHEKGEHGYGGIWGGVRATFHHNLIAHHNSRLPRFSGSSTTPNTADELVDFSNNVVYNWGQNNSYGGEGGNYNMINNYYKPGPATRPNRKDRIINPSEPYGKFFLSGNYHETNNEISADNRKGVAASHPDSALTNTEFKVERIALESAAKAYDNVLKNAGASLRRDAVDKRIITEVKTGTASHGKKEDGIIDSQRDVGGWPVLKSLPPLKDSDEDGMPDEWEKSNRLDFNDPADAAGHDLSTGYTNVEVYLNSLVAN